MDHLTGEFYIDEYDLKKFGCDVKIEAGFYSFRTF